MNNDPYGYKRPWRHGHYVGHVACGDSLLLTLAEAKNITRVSDKAMADMMRPDCPPAPPRGVRAEDRTPWESYMLPTGTLQEYTAVIQTRIAIRRMMQGDDS